MGSILGQFGLGGGGSEYNLEKMLHLAESQKMIFATLVDSVDLDGNANLIGNHIIRIYNLEEEWGYSEKGETAQLPHDEFSDYSRDDRKLMLRLYRRLLDRNEGALLSTSSDSGTGILEIKSSTLNEDLSLALTERLYAHLSNFYILESTGNNRATIKRLEAKADSIGILLNTKEYALAQTRDRGAGLIRQRDQVRQAQLQREVGMLTLAYGEVLQNLERASFALGNNTPFFQVIDAPFTPLPRVQTDWRTALIGGGFLGGFLVAVVLSAVKFVGDMSAKFKQEITARKQQTP